MLNMDKKIKIVFIHSGNALLPELHQYKNYFRFKYKVIISTDIKDAKLGDVVWFIMGSYRYKKLPHQVVIKEFPSLSLRPFAKFKNIVKSILAMDSDIRIYLNDDVMSGYYEKSSNLVLLRDMGVANSFTNVRYEHCAYKEYDLIYVGDMSASREIDSYLIDIIERNSNIRIALVGKKNKYIEDALSKYSDNIHFIGFVCQDDLPFYLNKSKAALNIIPNIYPYNLQTSTKLQEYVAFGIPIITTDYYWAKRFLDKYSVPYLLLEEYLSGREPIYYDVELNMCWEKIIESSKVEEKFLEMLEGRRSVK
ncbi:glycosyltransferase family 4 protein [Vibrio vulnificus]